MKKPFALKKNQWCVCMAWCNANRVVHDLGMTFHPYRNGNKPTGRDSFLVFLVWLCALGSRVALSLRWERDSLAAVHLGWVSWMMI